MSNQTQIQAGFQRLVTEFNAIKQIRGDESALSTSATNLVAAINEVLAVANAASSSGGAQINDASTNSTTETWSITQIAAELQAAKDDILGGAGAAYDTLAEIANEIQSNDTELGSLLTAIGNRVSAEAAQGLTVIQQQNARNNIDVFSRADIGDVTFDYVADINLTLT